MTLRLSHQIAKLGRSRRNGKNEDFSAYLVTSAQPDSPAAESYRVLRTNLLYGFMDDPPKTIVLTSPGAGEGKSITCANLGVVLAQAGKNTLVVDCDVRRPAMHKIFGLHNAKGLIDVLGEEWALHKAWQEPLENLKVIPVGLMPFNPTELLGSGRFAEFLKRVRGEFDYVLMDSSPVRLVSDPLILASQVDGVLLVFDAQDTRKGAVRQSIRSLEAIGANVLGTVMNDIKGPERAYYRHSYTYK